MAPEQASTPRRKTSRTKTAPAPAATAVDITAHARHGMIAEAAYLRAERRGFSPGYELDDWLAAEAEVDALLRAGQGTPQ
jgi:hypothetical protein